MRRALYSALIVALLGCSRTEAPTVPAPAPLAAEAPPVALAPPPEAAPQKEEWCELHDVPKAECTKCDPWLAVEFKDKGDWCRKHELPASHCRICNPYALLGRGPTKSR